MSTTYKRKLQQSDPLKMRCSVLQCYDFRGITFLQCPPHTKENLSLIETILPHTKEYIYDCLLTEPILMIVCQQTPHIYASYEQQPLLHTEEYMYDCLLAEPISMTVCQQTPHTYASYEQKSLTHTEEYIYDCLLTDTTYISEPIL